MWLEQYVSVEAWRWCFKLRKKMYVCSEKRLKNRKMYCFTVCTHHYFAFVCKKCQTRSIWYLFRRFQSYHTIVSADLPILCTSLYMCSWCICDSLGVLASYIAYPLSLQHDFVLWTPELNRTQKREKLLRGKICVWKKQGHKRMLSMPNCKEREKVKSDERTDTGTTDIFTLSASVVVPWLQLNSLIKQ